MPPLSKPQLRREHRARRKALAPEEIAARSHAIVERVLPLLQEAHRVALFWPMLQWGEVDLRGLDVELRARGVQLYYPYLDGVDIGFRELLDVTLLEKNTRGFMQPPAEALKPESLDAILVPALAATPYGLRLGYGAGHYDRILGNYCPPAVSIAVVFDFEIVSELPGEPHDVRVDWVVTDRRYVQT